MLESQEVYFKNDFSNFSFLSEIGIQAKEIDHVAFAVRDLETSVSFFEDFLGFKVIERRETNGLKTGMISATLKAGVLSFVLLQGTSPESQVSRFINAFAPGVHHIAIRVKDLKAAAADLAKRGVEFSTGEIYSADMIQIFTKRDSRSGLMVELIQRGSFSGFSDEGVNQLFRSLEEFDHF